MGLLVLLLACVGLAGAEPPASGPVSAIAPVPASAEQVAGWVGLLASPRYADRQAGSDALGRLGPKWLGELVEAYRDSDDLEARRRLRLAIEPLVVRHRLAEGTAQAFLGVGLVWLPPLPEQVPAAFHVSLVVPGSPAEAADLRVGDRILAIDDRPAEQWGGQDPAIAYIAGRRPGQPLRLRIARGDRVSEHTVVLGHRLAMLPEPQRTLERRRVLEAFWQSIEAPPDPQPASQPATP